MTDHDAIAAQLHLMSEACDCDDDYCRHAEAHDDAPDYDGMSAAYLDLYDEVKRLRVDMDQGALDYCDLMTRHDAHFVAWQSAKSRAEKAEAERERLLYVLDGVAGVIDTGRNEPLQVWRDQINIARQALKGQTND